MIGGSEKGHRRRGRGRQEGSVYVEGGDKAQEKGEGETRGISVRRRGR